MILFKSTARTFPLPLPRLDELLANPTMPADAATDPVLGALKLRLLGSPPPSPPPLVVTAAPLPPLLGGPFVGVNRLLLGEPLLLLPPLVVNGLPPALPLEGAGAVEGVKNNDALELELAEEEEAEAEEEEDEAEAEAEADVPEVLGLVEELLV